MLYQAATQQGRIQTCNWDTITQHYLPLVDKMHTLSLGGGKNATDETTQTWKQSMGTWLCALLLEEEQDDPGSKHAQFCWWFITCHPAVTFRHAHSSLPFYSQVHPLQPQKHTCGRSAHKGVCEQTAWSPSKWHNHHYWLLAPPVLQLQTYKEEKRRDRSNEYTSSAWPPV